MKDGLDRSEQDAELQAEAKARWGKTDSYKESARRTKQYSAEQWAAIKAEGADNEAAFAALLRQGGTAADEAAMELAEAARLHIDRWFYPCSPAMHVGLAEMYVGDARFRAHYDEQEPGLAAFVADAIRANAQRRAG
jgi:hypothetical protein